MTLDDGREHAQIGQVKRPSKGGEIASGSKGKGKVKEKEEEKEETSEGSLGRLSSMPLFLPPDSFPFLEYADCAGVVNVASRGDVSKSTSGGWGVSRFMTAALGV